MIKEISSKLGDLEFRKIDVPSWRFFVPEEAEKDGVKYLKKNDNIYMKTDKGYLCNSCGGVIMSAHVAHPIHDGIIPGSGIGQCLDEDVPYCPKCEEEPGFDGTIINIGNDPDLIEKRQVAIFGRTFGRI